MITANTKGGTAVLCRELKCMAACYKVGDKEGGGYHNGAAVSFLIYQLNATPEQIGRITRLIESLRAAALEMHKKKAASNE